MTTLKRNLEKFKSLIESELKMLEAEADSLFGVKSTDEELDRIIGMITVRLKEKCELLKEKRYEGVSKTAVNNDLQRLKREVNTNNASKLKEVLKEIVDLRSTLVFASSPIDVNTDPIVNAIDQLGVKSEAEDTSEVIEIVPCGAPGPHSSGEPRDIVTHQSTPHSADKPDSTLEEATRTPPELAELEVTLTEPEAEIEPRPDNTASSALNPAAPPIATGKQTASEKRWALRTTRKRKSADCSKSPIVNVPNVYQNENLPPAKSKRGEGKKRPKRAKMTPVISVTNAHTKLRADKTRVCASQTTPSVVGRKLEKKPGDDQGKKSNEREKQDLHEREQDLQEIEQDLQEIEADTDVKGALSIRAEDFSGQFVDKVSPLTLLSDSIEKTSETKPRTRAGAFVRRSSRKIYQKSDVTLLTASEDDSLPDPELSLDLENLKDNDVNDECDSSISLIPM